MKERRPAIFLSSSIPDALVSGFLLAAAGLVWVVMLVRVVGLRSFSKMTSFDFVMTVAMGSLVGTAATADHWSGFLQALAAMMALFVVQYLAAKARRTSEVFDTVLENQPMVLMRNGKFIDSALEQSRVDRDQLFAKLRSANVGSLDTVRAVVLETTGDVSVITGDRLDEKLLHGVEKKPAAPET